MKEFLSKIKILYQHFDTIILRGFMKNDKLQNILIIVLVILIITGIIILYIKNNNNQINNNSNNKPTIEIEEQIITPTDIPDSSKMPKIEKISFNIGMKIFFDPIKNEVCDSYNEEKSFRGANNGCMRFYGISNENGYVNMILDHDLNTIPTSWASRTDYPNEQTIESVGISNYGSQDYGTFGNNNRGPVSVLKLMLEYTKDWQTSVPDIYNYSNGFKINYYGHKARILTLNDVEEICKVPESINKDIKFDPKCPDWMYEQQGESKAKLYWGYWMADPAKNSTERAFRISNNGNVKDLYVDNGVGGVRPVLVIPEDKILIKIIEK